MGSTKLWAGVAVAAIVGLLGFVAYKVFLAAPDDRFAECQGGAVAGGPAAIGGPFELVSETGETVTDEDVITEPSLLYFGYTFCPDVCPLDTVRNAEAAEILDERGYSVTPVFISVDPARDTPEVMDDFTANVHDRMLGLTGSLEQVDAAAKAYRAYYNRHEDEDPDYYTVDHSTFTYLVFPESGFAGYFRRELTGEQLADRVQCFIDRM